MFKYCDIWRITDDLRVKNFSAIKHKPQQICSSDWHALTKLTQLLLQGENVDAKHSYIASTPYLGGDERLLKSVELNPNKSDRAALAMVVGFNFPEANREE